MARSSSRTRPKTTDEQPQMKIDRKQAFGDSETRVTHQECVPEAKGSDAQLEQTQVEEQPRKEADIDQDYDLNEPPYDPMDDYLASEQEATPTVRDQMALHDPLPKYLTDTKYLIDLVPTQKEKGLG